jgi:hypothetical protein
MEILVALREDGASTARGSRQLEWTVWKTVGV